MNSTPETILVVGGSGGIGLAMVRRLLNEYPMANITASYFESGVRLEHPRLQWRYLDVREEVSIQGLASEYSRVDWLINCVGFLHNSDRGPEKNIASVDADFLVKNIRLNTLPTLILAKQFARSLKQSPAPVIAALSAKVGSIQDNRLGGWYSYRIAKAALNMALKTLSIEWRISHPRGCVVALHPGTNDTALSRPFKAKVAADKLFQPACTAEMLVAVLSQLNPAQSGSFLAWDGSTLPW
jgi:NAD(P)-dependent dehydrogenase (short-subunit alcohol dehydrogenase family)